MYLKENKRMKIINNAKLIQNIATLETCGIEELVDLYKNNKRVREWFASWIVKSAKTIEMLLTE